VVNKIFVVQGAAQEPGVEHCYIQSGMDQGPCRRASGGAGPDDHNVVNRRAGASSLLTPHKDNPFFRPKIVFQATNTEMI
jgi:hypothetical protein